MRGSTRTYSIKIILLIIFIILGSFTYTAKAAEPQEENTTYQNNPTIGIRIAVIIFDPSGTINTRTLQEKVNNWLNSTINNIPRTINTVAGPLTIEYNITVDFYKANTTLDTLLASKLENLYTSNKTPEWAPDWAHPPRGYAWLNLCKAYNEIYTTSLTLISKDGGNPLDYNNIITIIGDLDGYSRVYYAEKNYPWVSNGTVKLEGVRGWGGPMPMSFYDLSTVIKPWPNYNVPYLNYYPPATPETDPPIWNLTDPTFYTIKLVEDDIAYHSIGEPLEIPTALSLNVTVAIINFNDTSRARELYNMTSPGETIRLIHMLTPWIKINFHRIIINATPQLMDIYQKAVENATRNNQSIIALPCTKIMPVLADIANNLTRGEELIDNVTLKAAWVFLILATPKPAYFQYSVTGYIMNCTGYSAGWYGATTYPGLDNRVGRAGLPRVIAHELGHSLGENHPFQSMLTYNIDWVMDEQATIMSYLDAGIACYGSQYTYSIERLSALQTLTLLKAYDTRLNQSLKNQAIELISQGKPVKALALVKEALMGNGYRNNTHNLLDRLQGLISHLKLILAIFYILGGAPLLASMLIIIIVFLYTKTTG